MRSLESLRTPAVLIDRARALRNLERMQAAANARGIRLRPHAKTHKSPLIARWQIERGAIGICCAKLGEAEVFADAGIADIRLPYPLNPANADRVIALLDRTHLSFIVDHPAVATAVVRGDDAGAAQQVDVLVKVDVGFHRCGIDPAARDAVAMIRGGGRAAGPALQGPALARRPRVSRALRRRAVRDGRGRSGARCAIWSSAAAATGVDDRGGQRRRDAAGAVLAAAGRLHRVPARQLRLLRSHAGRARRRDARRLRAHGAGDGRQQAGRGPRSSSIRGSKTLTNDGARGFTPAPGFGVVLREDGTPDTNLLIERLSEEHATVKVLERIDAARAGRSRADCPESLVRGVEPGRSGVAASTAMRWNRCRLPRVGRIT